MIITCDGFDAAIMVCVGASGDRKVGPYLLETCIVVHSKQTIGKRRCNTIEGI